jgi:hypothetical protein
MDAKTRAVIKRAGHGWLSFVCPVPDLASNKQMELNLSHLPPSYKTEARTMDQKNERVELETKIMKYRSLARDAADEVTTQRISALVAELEQKLRKFDE